MCVARQGRCVDSLNTQARVHVLVHRLRQSMGISVKGRGLRQWRALNLAR